MTAPSSRINPKRAQPFFQIIAVLAILLIAASFWMVWEWGPGSSTYKHPETEFLRSLYAGKHGLRSPLGTRGGGATNKNEKRFQPGMKTEPLSHWKYRAFLPIPRGKIITMNEGGTALVPSVKKSNVLYKLEYENPTGSFKDRGSTVEISHAHADKFKKVICASTGNMGASISAYAARAGIAATIIVPGHVPENKLNQIQAYGATLIKMKGTYTDALRKTWEMAARDKGFMLTGDYPLRAEGQKTIGFELVDQLEGRAPDQIIIPVGNGTLLVALHAAFTQLREKKQIKKMPKLIGVQAARCAPLVRAWEQNSLRYVPVNHPHTIAGAIECGNPVYGQDALRVVNQTGGKMIQVSEAEMRHAKQSLAQEEGLYSEYSGAAVQAVVEKYAWKGTTIALLCGHGLKE